MSNYALIQNGTVAELFTPPEGFTLAQCFTPAMVAQFVDVTSANPAPALGDTATETGGAWSFAAPAGPTLAQQQAAQNAAMSAACQAAILSGFTSSGLGSAYNYPCDAVTQTNIIAASDHGGSLWCQPQAGGAWAFQAHSEAQATQVYSDMTAHIQAQQTIYAGLLAQIAAATTVAAVQAIVWP
ncbi:MAG TPA: hypothetical protein VMH92_03995 [Acidocella sp.]|nr:hypothetical protein [Acidocella sp.]